MAGATGCGQRRGRPCSREGIAMRWLLLVFLGLSLTAAEGKGETSLPSPPFVREWTHESGDDTQIIGAWNQTLCYSSKEGLGALDPASGKLLWRVRAGVHVAGAVLHRNRIYAVAPVEKGAELLEVEAASGRERVLARLPVPGRYVEVGGGRVFVLDNAGTVHAWDIATGKPHWSRTLVRRSQETWPFAELAWTPGGLYVAIEVAEWGFGDRYEAVRFGLNPTRGHVRWQRKGGPDYHLPPLGLDEDVIVYGDGPLRLQVATGKVVWRR
ncbi:MAG: hypothetical protein FJ315_03865, partial [SAR202 cluster bacterium]|nr:hypothetical protein [SAR202 cluster bacterium]